MNIFLILLLIIHNPSFNIMNKEEYKKLENEIYTTYKRKLHKLRNEYVEKNKKFNIGYEMLFDNIVIVYYGYRYRKVKNEIIRTKDKLISSLRESGNLKILIK